VRFKNFSHEVIKCTLGNKNWIFPAQPGSHITVVEFKLIEPGEVTAEFEENDPVVQVMLNAHPELRPFVVPSVWEWIRSPAL
jgi:hypothetical protein